MLKKYYKKISINKEDIIKIKQYKICFKAKAINNINKKPSNKKYRYLEKVIIDIQGLIKVYTYKKYIYFITFLDKGIQYLKISLYSRNLGSSLDLFLNKEILRYYIPLSRNVIKYIYLLQVETFIGPYISIITFFRYLYFLLLGFLFILFIALALKQILYYFILIISSLFIEIFL